MLMTGLRVIFFDAAGTLIGLPRSVAFHYCDVAVRHGLDVPSQAMYEAFCMTWKEMPAPVTTRIRRPDDDQGWWQEFVGRVLEKVAVDRDFNRAAYFEELYAEFTKPGVWDVYPETREVLAALAGRYRLGIISNFDGRLRAILEELGLATLFAHVIISSEVGADKPDPWIFQEALRLANVDASEVLHVGDEPVGDWEGGAQAGMHVFKLKRPENSLRDVFGVLGGGG
jgi:putative hydrolase of the HAD superfamily